MIAYDPRGWLSVVLRLRGSVLPRLTLRILLTVAVGALSSYLHDTRGLSVPSIAHTLIGVALGLLLVFRTNASYDRYWEGRRLLGQMVNRSRDLARQIATFVTGDDDAVAGEQRTMQRHVAAFFGLGRQSLRAERDLAALGPLLTDAERATLEPLSSRPAVVLTWISARLVTQLAAGRLSEQRLQACDANLTSLVDSLGGCERIARTPIPFAYAQHIKSFVLLFCFTAPFAMVDTMRWLTPAVSGLLAFALFGIDEIGVEIEDPFGYDDNDLPVEDIGKTIERDTAEILAAPRC